MHQGEVWWADLPRAAGRRPVVLVTRESAIAVRNAVTVAPVTRTIRHIGVEVALDERDGPSSICVILVLKGPREDSPVDSSLGSESARLRPSPERTTEHSQCIGTQPSLQDRGLMGLHTVLSFCPLRTRAIAGLCREAHSAPCSRIQRLRNYGTTLGRTGPPRLRARARY